MSEFPPWRKAYDDLLDDIAGYLAWFAEDSEPWKAKHDKEFRAKLDELMFKAFRSGLIKVSPEKGRCLDLYDDQSEQVILLNLKVHNGLERYPEPSSPQEQAAPDWLQRHTTPAFIYSFHPELPEWAVALFSSMLETYRALGQKEYLKRVGLAEGVLPPIPIGRDQELLERVLVLRGCQPGVAESLSDPSEETGTSEQPKTVMGILEELRAKRRARSFEHIREYSRKIEERIQLDKALRSAPERQAPRVRKEKGAWRQVIRSLVKEGLLERPISHQAFKKMLKKKFPWIEWDQV